MSKRYASGFQYYPTDPIRLKQEVKQLEALGFEPERYTEHQIKIGPFNWYWRRGTITKDPDKRLMEKGFSGLLKVLQPSPKISELKVYLEPPE